MTNLDAFLTMVAKSEGVLDIPGGDNGYNVLVTSTPENPKLFTSYADHPRQLMRINSTSYSTAAGRYQILASIYDAYRRTLDIPDFSPDSQDAIAIHLIKECGALPDIAAGQLSEAIQKCASRWASLPGNSYGQHQNTMPFLRTAFTAAGGVMAATEFA